MSMEYSAAANAPVAGEGKDEFAGARARALLDDCKAVLSRLGLLYKAQDTEVPDDFSTPSKSRQPTSKSNRTPTKVVSGPDTAAQGPLSPTVDHEVGRDQAAAVTAATADPYSLDAAKLSQLGLSSPAAPAVHGNGSAAAGAAAQRPAGHGHPHVGPAPGSTNSSSGGADSGCPLHPALTTIAEAGSEAASRGGSLGGASQVSWGTPKVSARGTSGGGSSSHSHGGSASNTEGGAHPPGAGGRHGSGGGSLPPGIPRPALGPSMLRVSSASATDMSLDPPVCWPVGAGQGHAAEPAALSPTVPPSPGLAVGLGLCLPSEPRKVPRPKGVPRLNLNPVSDGKACDSPRGPRPAGNGGEVVETEEDVAAELASWTQPGKWQPTHQGRYYVYKPVTSMEVKRYEALHASLPPAQAQQVAGLWAALIQARYACELMASRGVRVSKDITAEWSEMSQGLMERVERYEREISDLKACVDHQSKVIAQLQSAASSSAAPSSPAAGGVAGGALRSLGRLLPSRGAGRDSCRGGPPCGAAPGATKAGQYAAQYAASKAAAAAAAAAGSSASAAAGAAGGVPKGAAAEVLVGALQTANTALTEQNADLESEIRDLKGLFLAASDEVDSLSAKLGASNAQGAALWDAHQQLSNAYAAMAKERDAMKGQCEALAAQCAALACERDVADSRALQLAQQCALLEGAVTRTPATPAPAPAHPHVQAPASAAPPLCTPQWGAAAAHANTPTYSTGGAFASALAHASAAAAQASCGGVGSAAKVAHTGAGHGTTLLIPTMSSNCHAAPPALHAHEPTLASGLCVPSVTKTRTSVDDLLQSAAQNFGAVASAAPAYDMTHAGKEHAHGEVAGRRHAKVLSVAGADGEEEAELIRQLQMVNSLA